MLISAFPSGATVKNLFYPYEELTLEASTFSYGIEGSTELNGCLSSISMAPWDYKAFVPIDGWRTPAPTITRVIPGHDSRLESTTDYYGSETVPIQVGAFTTFVSLCSNVDPRVKGLFQILL